MGLPAKLTEEEEALKKRYVLLRKKREELRIKLAKIAANDNPKLTNTSKKESQAPPKPSVDAKELAKRKILSGEVKLVTEKSEQRFKRARSLTDKKERDHPNDEDKYNLHVNTGSHCNSSFSPLNTSSDTDTSQNESSHPRTKSFERRKGNTIYVSGYGLQESILENSFTKFGTLKNVHLEPTKGYGFVTFSTNDAAEKAISEMNGEMVQGITLRVALARKQPFENKNKSYDRDERRAPFNRALEMPLPKDTEKLKTSEDQNKGNRTLVVYDDNFEF